jgi:hypothetical protein
MAGLPGRDPNAGPPDVPSYYSPAVQRWLPVSAGAVAPDGRTYAWVKTLPVGRIYSNFKSSELLIHDVAASTDRIVWTYAGTITVWRWDSGGIRVNVGRVKSNQPSQTWWFVEPVSGALTRDNSNLPFMSFAPFKPLPGDPHDPGFTTPGMTTDSHIIWWIGNLDTPGAIDWVFYETAPGHRVYLYRGVEGTATSFDPELALVDSTGIWFSDADYVLDLKPAVWHWQLGIGLRKYRLAGLPALLKGSNAYILVRPAGPCF